MVVRPRYNVVKVRKHGELVRFPHVLEPRPPPEPQVIVVEQEAPYDSSRRFMFDWQP